MGQLKYYEDNAWKTVGLPPEIAVSSTQPVAGDGHELLWVDTSVNGIIPADYAVADNLNTTQSGLYVLDAHQGKVLNDSINNLQSQLDGLYVDITSECVMQNSWSVEYNSFKVLDCHSFLLIIGLLKAGTLGVNVNICSIPSRIGSKINGYVYGEAAPLGNTTRSWVVVRDNYLRQDNNAAITGSTGSWVAFQCVFPYQS